MPVYEYKCDCGRAVERMYPMSNIPKFVKCECGEWAGRAYSTLGFILKGGGWAKDGYSKEERV